MSDLCTGQSKKVSELRTKFLCILEKDLTAFVVNLEDPKKHQGLIPYDKVGDIANCRSEKFGMQIRAEVELSYMSAKCSKNISKNESTNILSNEVID